MIRRLFAVALFAVAVCTAQSAHAATLSVASPYCWNNGFSNVYNYGTYECHAGASGGTNTYIYRWTMRTTTTDPGVSWTTSTPDASGTCSVGTSYTFVFTVTDSAGATASGQTRFTCRQWAE